MGRNFNVVLCILFLLAFVVIIGCDSDSDDSDCQSCPDPDDDDDDDDNDDNDDNDDDNNDDNDDNDDDNDDDDTVDPVTLNLIAGCNHFSTSNECYLPYPSFFHQVADTTSPTGVRNDYPTEIMPTGIMPAFDMTRINNADGVSPAGPILLHFAKDIDPNYLTTVHEMYESHYAGSPIALINMESGERVTFLSEMDMNRKQLFPNRYAMIIRPMEPMEMGQRHVVVLTKDLTDDTGQPLESPEAFAVLRDNIPTTNTEIETIRPHFEQLFTFLEGQGYARENLLLAYDFMVASEDYLLGSILTMRQVALDESLDTGMNYTITSVQDDPNEYLARIVEGEFEVPSFLNADSAIEFDANLNPIRQADNGWYEYTMIIPKKAVTQKGPLPLMVFGHGIFGKGRNYLESWPGTMLHQYAEDSGVIMIATDWIGLSGGDLNLIISEILPNLNRVVLVTDRLQQSLVNNIVLTELALGNLEEDPQIKFGSNDLIDDTKVYYYGVSLGGIQGSSFVSLSNRIERGVLAVPGCVWLNLIPRSIVWVPIKAYLDVFYPDPLVQQIGIALIQTMFDNSDPVNLTKLMFKSPLPDAPPGRSVIVQESIGDSQVPNMTTEMLARAIGLDLMTPSIYPVFELPSVTSPSMDPALLQYHMVSQTQGAMPPEENIPPSTENGVHADMCFLPNVVEQVFNFIITGEVVQYCNNTCDPD